MKIPHGKCMSSPEIRLVIDSAKFLVRTRGVDPDTYEKGWRQVVDWLVTRRTKRTPRQAAAHFLDCLRDEILGAGI